MLFVSSCHCVLRTAYRDPPPRRYTTVPRVSTVAVVFSCVFSSNMSKNFCELKA